MKSAETATIASLKRRGLKGYSVICDECGHTTYHTWGGLSDDLPFLEIPIRHLQCSSCGGREFHLAMDWQDHRRE